MCIATTPAVDISTIEYTEATEISTSTPSYPPVDQARAHTTGTSMRSVSVDVCR